VNQISLNPPRGKTAWSQKLSRFKIGERLVGCFLVLILLMLAGNGLRFSELRLVRVQAEQLDALDQELISVLRFQNTLGAFYSRLNGLAQSQDKDRFIAESDLLRSQVLEEAKRTESSFNNLPPDLRADPAVVAPIQAVQSALPSYLDSMNTLASSGDWTALHFRLERQIQPLESLGSDLVRNVDEHVASSRARAIHNFRRAERRIFLIYLLTAIFTLIVAGLLTFATTQSITTPLGDLVEGSKALARGAFEHQIPVRGSDELAHLAAVFNESASKLHSLYEELQQLVDFVPQMIVVLQPDGKWIHANRVTLEYTGLTVQDYRAGDVIDRVIHPDDVETFRLASKRGVSKNVPFEVEARILGKDQIYRWFLLRFQPFLEHGSVGRWYGTALEIESRKQEEERVRRENVLLEERTRIAQELHDTLLQTFLGASMQLTVAAELVPEDQKVTPLLARILQTMQNGIREGRAAIQDLRAPDSSTPDLVQALSLVQREVAANTDAKFHVKVVGRQQPLQPAIRHEVYRIAREALMNAFCHSRAASVDLELEYADNELRVFVRDNGCGIDPQVLQEGRKGHWGLPGMRERAAKIGALLKISSSGGTGTQVQVSLPAAAAYQLETLNPVDK
jgi:PAS domain S-box-containing protein